MKNETVISMTWIGVLIIAGIVALLVIRMIDYSVDVWTDKPTQIDTTTEPKPLPDSMYYNWTDSTNNIFIFNDEAIDIGGSQWHLLPDKKNQIYFFIRNKDLYEDYIIDSIYLKRSE